MSLDMELLGVKELEHRFNQLANRMQNKIVVAAATRAMTEAVLPVARANCPMDSGALRDSLFVAPTRAPRPGARISTAAPGWSCNEYPSTI